MSEQSGFGDGHKKPKMVRKEELRKKPSKLKKNETGGGGYNLDQGEGGWPGGEDGCLWGCMILFVGFILFCILAAVAGA